jgi:hypothetical protein
MDAVELLTTGSLICGMTTMVGLLRTYVPQRIGRTVPFALGATGAVDQPILRILNKKMV